MYVYVCIVIIYYVCMIMLCLYIIMCYVMLYYACYNILALLVCASVVINGNEWHGDSRLLFLTMNYDNNNDKIG